MVILGLGGLLGDAACAALKNGEIVAAIEETKIARVVRPGSIPAVSVSECLRIAGATRDEVECVGVVRPFTSGRESQFHLDLRDQFPRAEIILVEHRSEEHTSELQSRLHLVC